jgi:hypothetical protein
MAIQADDGKQYRVRLKKPVRVSEHVVMTPATDNVVKGKVLKTLPEEAVASYEELA